MVAKVTFVEVTPEGKFAEPACTEEPSLSWTACQKISLMLSGAPSIDRSNTTVVELVSWARSMRAPMLVPEPEVR